MDPFDQKKLCILAKINVASEVFLDASPKGTIDALCRPLIDTINAHPHMVTTSLCLGRVSVFLEGVKQKAQIGAKGNDGRWLFVTHDPADLPHWPRKVDFVFESLPALDDHMRMILYKFEPLILHVKCRDVSAASRLYAVAMRCGFRESGIGSNNLVAIRILIRLDVPIGYLRGDTLVAMVPYDYLHALTKLSEDRFAENFRKMDALRSAIAELGETAKETALVETKEERRERKTHEGLERRAAILEEKARKKEKAKQGQRGAQGGGKQ